MLRYRRPSDTVVDEMKNLRRNEDWNVRRNED